MKTKTILTAVAILVSLTSFVQAHDGRRLSVFVGDDGRLTAQGYLSGENPSDDGAGVVRPYFNAIHGHFGNDVLGVYPATLPGFDVFDPTAQLLSDGNLEIQLVSAFKWENPMMGVTPTSSDFDELDATETIGIGFGNQPSIDTDNLGSFELVEEFNGAATDIDLNYSIASDPANTLYALEWILSTDVVGIDNSLSVYTILSPPGNGPVERLHHQSLALESALGVTAVPEPSSLLLLTLAGSICSTRRRKK